MPVRCIAAVPLPQASLTRTTRNPSATASLTVASTQASVHTPVTNSHSMPRPRSSGSSRPSPKAFASALISTSSPVTGPDSGQSAVSGSSLSLNADVPSAITGWKGRARARSTT